MKKGKIILAIVCSLFMAWGILSSPASAFPDKPITMTVSFSAGGSTDVAARTIAVYMEKYLGQPVVIKNLPGASGQVGWTKLSRSKPDGYTIGFVNLPALNMVYALREGVAYHPVKSFVPIGCNIIDPNTVLVRIDDDRFKTIKDLIEYARKNPGKVICSLDGPVSDDRLALVKMEKATGVKFSAVFYHGSAPANAALMGGHGDFTITNTFDVIKYKDKERCLVQMWKERYHMNPDTPTFKEVFGKDIIGASTRGMAAPAGVPADRLKILRDAFEKAANDPEFKERANKIGLTLAWLSADEFGTFIKNLQNDVDTLIDELK
ncbi:MAG: tripartite tricarboxylate transporter substrate binding protein [Deltaproteobacteria bacterium]|nr:tripartite tricarboxylate transporter substrate binding protein [Deltaproteobacteria bacterium]MBW2307089.1 tripartite tricarboxylate transporter substrate binding protein [Deltaproteobacteria bacterium]